MGENVATIAKRIDISNEEFLKGVFGAKWKSTHVCSFKEDPYDLDNLGLRHYWAGGHAKDKLRYCLQDFNTYFTISQFALADDGKARRRKDLFNSTYVICFDDVVEKIDPEKLKDLPEPSYVLETSAGSSQWGYILEVAETNQNRVDALLGGLVAAGITDSGKDPGMMGVTRYVRLPIGSNTKKKYKSVFKTKLTTWEPDKTYRLEDLARPFSIDVTNVSTTSTKYVAGLPEDIDPIVPLLQQAGVFKGKIKPDTYDIECPWVGEHTGAADSGAAYLSPFGFRCHHGSHDATHFGDLLDYLDKQIPGAKASVRWAQMVHEFDEKERWPFEIAKTWKTREEIAAHAGWLGHLQKLDPLSYDSLTDGWDIINGVPESVILDIEDAAAEKIIHAKTGGLKIIKPGQWSGKTVPPREWVVEDWLPRGKVTSLYGDGGLGKTLTAQMLATCLSVGGDWLGEKTQESNVLAVLCEDDEDEIHRRQEDINSHYVMDMKTWETQDTLSYMCREGEDSLLMTFDSQSIGTLTPFWTNLRDAAVAQKADVIVLDTLADIFGGNEVSRLEVRQFVQRALLGLAQAIGGSVLFLAHPSQAGKASGQGFSGSTAWNNSVRSRWYLSSMEDDGRSGLRRLSRVKSNYSASGSDTDKILEWTKGAFTLVRSVGDGEVDSVTGRFVADIEMETAIQDAIAHADAKEIVLSVGKAGGGTYVVAYAKLHIPAAQKYNTEEIEKVLKNMKESGSLDKKPKTWYRPDSNRKAEGLTYIDQDGSASGAIFGDKKEADPFG
jgi:RecA-family ATPase